jgi:predicted RNA-binding Zn ribbon-like protein
VGGDVALDFANTDIVSDGDRSTDVLRSVEEFLAWCRYAGVAAASSVHAGTSADEEQSLLRTATHVRAAIRIAMVTVARHLDIDPSVLHTLRSAYADAIGQATPGLDGDHLSWAWEPGSPRAALSELVASAVDLLRDHPAGRLKECPSCGFVFLDATRNGSRRWCSMEDCGTEEKMRRYVAKRAEARARPTSTPRGPGLLNARPEHRTPER